MQRLKSEIRPTNYLSSFLGDAPKMAVFGVGDIGAGPVAAAMGAGPLASFVLKTAAGSALESLVEGNTSPTHIAGQTAENVVGMKILEGVGKYVALPIARPLGRFLKGLVWPVEDISKPLVDKALGVISEASGVDPATVAAKVNNVDDLVQGLHAVGAPKEFTDRVVAEGASAFKADFGDWYGQFAAVNGISKADLESTITKWAPDQPEFGKAARESFGARLGLRTPEDTSKVIEARVVDKPYEIGGANKYFPQFSKWHLENDKLGPTNIVTKQFSNPIEVTVDAGQIPSYALISSIRSNPKLVAATLQALEYKTSKAEIPFSRMANVTEALANRLAKTAGYDSIVYKTPRFDQNSFVDLTNVKPLDVKAERVVNEFEKSLAAAGRRALQQNFLAPLLIAGGVGAGVAASPSQTQGAEFPVEPLERLIEPAGKGLAKRFLEGFTELITPENKAIRPPEALDFRSPLYNPLEGQKPIGHDELALNTLTGEDKADLVKGGYVRALRENDTLGLEFNPDHEEATNNAIDFLRRNFRLGDNVRIDRGVQSGEFYLPGQAAQFIRKGIVPPVGNGLGELAGEGERVGELGSLGKLVSKYSTVDELAANVEPKLGSILRQVSAMTGKTDPTEVVDTLNMVKNDLSNLSGGAVVTPFDIGPDYVGVNISHSSLGPFPLATINGVVDPHSGTWYPQVKSSPLGIGQKAVREVFRQVKGLSPLITKLGKPSGIAGILAATAIGKAVYNLVEPDQASAAEFPVEPVAKPILEMLMKGIRGVGEGALEDTARAVSGDDLVQATLSRATNTQAKMASEDLSQMNTGDHSFLSFPAMADLSPEALQMVGSATKGENHNSLYFLRPFFSRDEDPAFQAWQNLYLNEQGNMFRGQQSTRGLAQRQAYDLAKDLGEDDKKELTRALYGLRPKADGGYLQTEADIPKNVSPIAETITREILDKFDQGLTGVDPRAVGVMRDLGLEESQRNWRIVDALQKEAASPTEGFKPPPGTDDRHIAAAKAMEGMLDIRQPYQWANLDVPYAQRHFNILPVRQERQALVDALKKFDIYGAEMPQDVLDRRQNLVNRLNTLNQLETNRSRPSMTELKPTFFAPMSDVSIPEEVQETDPLRLLLEHIDGATSRMFFDKHQYLGKLVADNARRLGNTALADSIPEWLNTVNGTKSRISDIQMQQAVNNVLSHFTNYRFTLDQVRKPFKALQEFTYMAKLGFGLRFPLVVNPTQPIQTIAGLTDYGPLLRAAAKVWNDPEIWKEAASQKLYNIGQSKELAEIQSGKAASGFKTAMDYLTNKSEGWNAVIGYQAVKDWVYDQYARTGTVKVPHFIKGFDRTILGSGDVEKIAQSVARAASETANFMHGAAGKPMAIVGGAAKNVGTQFKGFQLGYGDWLAGGIEHGKRTGDWGPMLRNTLGLIALGGVGTVLPYDTARLTLIKMGYDVLPPPSSGIGALISLLTSTFSTPNTKAQIDDALGALQISSSYDLTNMGKMTGDSVYKSLIELGAGPTYGTMLNNMASLTGDKAPAEKFHEVLRQTVPTANSMMEASQALGIKQLNDAYSALGYRGGLYSPTGKLQMNQPSKLQILGRAMNLTPSWNSQRYQHKVAIQAALDGGQNALAQTLLNRARDNKFRFTNQDFSSMKGSATAKTNKANKPNEELR